MEKLRIAERNRVNLEIKSIETYITRNKATIDRFRSQEKSAFNEAQIVKLTEKINIDKVKLKSLEDIIQKLDSNTYDVFLMEKKEADAIINKKQAELGEKKNRENYQKKLDEKEKKENYYKSNKGSGGVSDHAMQNEADKYFYIIGQNDDYEIGKKKFPKKIPDWIHENLKEMPNNKGHIFNGIWCFGELPAKSLYPLVMQERTRDKRQLTYEITETHITTFEKIGKGRDSKRIFISKEARTKINWTKIR